eukprot:m.400868 g.400868  ORF g.400868 m.400868 type:complete len:535 (-) comp20115_c2_seq26:908-2512(-)
MLNSGHHQNALSRNCLDSEQVYLPIFSWDCMHFMPSPQQASCFVFFLPCFSLSFSFFLQDLAHLLQGLPLALAAGEQETEAAATTIVDHLARLANGLDVQVLTSVTFSLALSGLQHQQFWQAVVSACSGTTVAAWDVARRAELLWVLTYAGHANSQVLETLLQGFDEHITQLSSSQIVDTLWAVSEADDGSMLALTESQLPRRLLEEVCSRRAQGEHLHLDDISNLAVACKRLGFDGQAVFAQGTQAERQACFRGAVQPPRQTERVSSTNATKQAHDEAFVFGWDAGLPAQVAGQQRRRENAKLDKEAQLPTVSAPSIQTLRQRASSAVRSERNNMFGLRCQFHLQLASLLLQDLSGSASAMPRPNEPGANADSGNEDFSAAAKSSSSLDTAPGQATMQRLVTELAASNNTWNGGLPNLDLVAETLQAAPPLDASVVAELLHTADELERASSKDTIGSPLTVHSLMGVRALLRDQLQRFDASSTPLVSAAGSGQRKTLNLNAMTCPSSNPSHCSIYLRHCRGNLASSSTRACPA